MFRKASLYVVVVAVAAVFIVVVVADIRMKKGTCTFWSIQTTHLIDCFQRSFFDQY